MTDYPPLSDDQKREVCAALTLGATYEVAANIAKCAEQAIYAEERRTPAFAESAAHCRLRSEIKLLSLVHKAAEDSKQWRAAAWMLERLYPDRYAKRKPNTIPPSRVNGLLRQAAEVIMAEFPPDLQDRFRTRLDEIITSSYQPLKDRANDNPTARAATNADDAGASRNV